MLTTLKLFKKTKKNKIIIKLLILSETISNKKTKIKLTKHKKVKQHNNSIELIKLNHNIMESNNLIYQVPIQYRHLPNNNNSKI